MASDYKTIDTSLTPTEQKSTTLQIMAIGKLLNCLKTAFCINYYLTLCRITGSFKMHKCFSISMSLMTFTNARKTGIERKRQLSYDTTDKITHAMKPEKCSTNWGSQMIGREVRV